MRKLWIDLETKAPVSILEVGTDAYAQHAKLLIVAYAIDDGPVRVWQVTLDDCAPGELIRALNDPTVEIWAHNARFERTVMRRVGLTHAPIERWRCTMSQAYAHALPAALDNLGRFLGLPPDQQKMAAGKKLIKLFCEPPYADPREHPVEWEQFVEYAMQDVETMRLCAARMPSVNYPDNEAELKLWFLDQRISDRGAACDLELAEAAIEALNDEKVKLDSLASDLTNGRITSGTQRERLQKYLNDECGLDLPDMTKATLNAVDATGDAATLLSIRSDVSRASTAKYARLLGAQVGGRLRGSMQFCGADRTGRWAGRIVNPMNLPKPTLTPAEIEAGIEALKGGHADLLVSSVHELASNALRGLFVAPTGKKLVVADWNSIEGMLLAWEADERWVLDAYAARRDMYIETYCKTFNVAPFEKKDKRRTHGKVIELFGGYGGGVGAIISFSKIYDVPLEELGESAYAVADDEVRSSARWMWEEWAVPRGETYDLPQRLYEGLQCIKIMWRNARPATVALWRALESAVREAVQNPKRVTHAGKASFMCSGAYLAMRLPSGRLVLYAQPKLRKDEDDRTIVTYLDSRGGRRPLWGGLIAENLTQANGREILAWALPRIEAAGYETVLHVYDEVVAEGEDHERLCAIMCEPPPWGTDIPLAAEGFTTTRYRKE